MIVDVDVPNAPFGNKFLSHSVHMRNNFREYIIFDNGGDVSYPAERCSTQLKWAFIADVARSIENKVVFIINKPQNGVSTNEVLIGKYLPDLKLSLPKPTLTTANDKKIKQKDLMKIELTGTNLVGECYLEKGGEKIPARSFRVKETDLINHFSDLKKVEVRFYITDAVSTGWKLVIKNSTGQSSISGFEIIP